MTPVYVPNGAKIATRRERLAPDNHDAFEVFSTQAFVDDALDANTKQLIAVAVAHVTQGPCCIQSHTKAALHGGATEQQLMEASWVAEEMRAGGASAHSTFALKTARNGQDRECVHATPHNDRSGGS
jgi:AhpD family alkylhydroperoxidase